MMLLQAKAIGIEDSRRLGCFVIGFAEYADGTGPALIFQRAHRFDAQDAKLGMDTYCLVTDSQATTYGGVEAWTLAEGRLELSLSTNAANDLGVHQDLVVEFASGRTGDVEAALHRIFTGKRQVKAPRPSRRAHESPLSKSASAHKAKAQKTRSSRARAGQDDIRPEERARSQANHAFEKVCHGPEGWREAQVSQVTGCPLRCRFSVRRGQVAPIWPEVPIPVAEHGEHVHHAPALRLSATVDAAI